MSKVEELLSRSSLKRARTGASGEELSLLISKSPTEIPGELLEFLRITNGGDGKLSEYPHFVIFFAASHLIAINAAFPGESGLFAFATNGVGTYMAFDCRLKPSGIVAVEVPFDDSVKPRFLARDFASFLLLVK